MPGQLALPGFVKKGQQSNSADQLPFRGRLSFAVDVLPKHITRAITLGVRIKIQSHVTAWSRARRTFTRRPPCVPAACLLSSHRKSGFHGTFRGAARRPVRIPAPAGESRQWGACLDSAPRGWTDD